MSERRDDGSLTMLTVDFSNDFHLVDITVLLREVMERYPSIFLCVDFLCGKAVQLYIGDGFIWSATCVQQGDPLRLLLFFSCLAPASS